MRYAVALSYSLHGRLLHAAKARHPVKSFGYLLASGHGGVAEDFVLFEDNVRNTPDWRPSFEAYGRYFLDHDDAGFVATPEESWRVQQEIWARGLHEVAVFHTHQRHPANLSRIDYELHVSRFAHLWHLIISLRNLDAPQVRAFAISDGTVSELDVDLVDLPTGIKPHDRAA